MNPNESILLCVGICAGAALLTGICGKGRRLTGFVALAAVAASSLLVLRTAAGVLLEGPQEATTFLTLPALGSSLRFHVDGLSALFLTLIATVALLSAIYSVSYMKHYRGLRVGAYYPYFLLFVSGMYGIVVVTDLMVFFFLFWQLMTLPSYALVRFEYTRPENVRAAGRYLLMMQISCLLVMLGSALLAPSMAPENLAKFDFEAVSGALASPGILSKGLTTLALFLCLVGFGIKAGMWPFGQLWLPDAHPAAPSPVSALLSGVMIKTGVYGLLRTFLWLVPPEAADGYPGGRWGLLIAAVGTITLFIGTMQALRQEQSKRLLAFHSIGQVGYILLGMGTCLALLGPSREEPALRAVAALGLYGAVFHTINHGLFKSLLFLNAGSMLHATGTQDLNRMGGLLRYMPLTGITALVASFSIAGVPLFNGFASKWTIFVPTILGGHAVGYLPVCGIIAALTSALTLASFMKFYGTSFLSRRSKLVAARVEAGRLEVDGWMGLPQWILAALCLALGLAPAAAYDFMGRAFAATEGGVVQLLASSSPATSSGLTGLSLAGQQAVFGPIVVFLVLGILLLLAVVVSRLGGARRRADSAWLCGYARETDHHRYGAHNLYGEVKKYFQWVGGESRDKRAR